MCPDCAQPMYAYEIDGVEIDHCAQCDGTWLDAGELEQLCRLAGIPDGPVTYAIEQATGGAKGDRRCPRCRRRMRLIDVGDQDPVTLDKCPREHGLWFDPGEMQTLVKEHFKDSDDEGVLARYFGRLFGIEGS